VLLSSFGCAKDPAEKFRAPLLLDAQGTTATEAAAALQHMEKQTAREGEGLIALGHHIVPALLGAVDFTLANDLPGIRELFSAALEATSAGVSTLSGLRWDAQTCTSAVHLLKMVPQVRAELLLAYQPVRCYYSGLCTAVMHS